MKGRAILLAARPDGAEAAAILIDGRLDDLILTRRVADEWGAEAIASGAVERLLPTAEGGRGAAFLSFGDGAPKGYLADAGALKEGDRVLAEIRTFPSGAKAWPMTRRLSLRSRRLTLTPGAPGLNLSRSIVGEPARAAIASALQSALGDQDHVGCVARSAAGADFAGLAEEAAWLLEQQRALEAAAGHGLRRAAPGAVVQALRGWRAGASVLAAGPVDAALGQAVAPSDPIRGRIEIDSDDPFERFDVWSQADAALTPRSALPSGGALTLEATAALTAVDVDSGEAAAQVADIEAARALPRLLRIGGHGGLVAVDFLARSPRRRKSVEAALLKALKDDPVETAVLGWTTGGLLEARRKRARRRLTRIDLEDWVRG